MATNSGKGNDVDKVNESIRRLLEGQEHDEVMRKVALAKDAREYGAKIRGTVPNDEVTRLID